jgi:hypothetical protein
MVTCFVEAGVEATLALLLSLFFLLPLVMG